MTYLCSSQEELEIILIPTGPCLERRLEQGVKKYQDLSEERRNVKIILSGEIVPYYSLKEFFHIKEEEIEKILYIQNLLEERNLYYFGESFKKKRWEKEADLKEVTRCFGYDISLLQAYDYLKGKVKGEDILFEVKSRNTIENLIETSILIQEIIKYPFFGEENCILHISTDERHFERIKQTFEALEDELDSQLNLKLKHISAPNYSPFYLLYAEIAKRWYNKNLITQTQEKNSRSYDLSQYQNESLLKLILKMTDFSRRDFNVVFSLLFSKIPFFGKKIANQYLRFYQSWRCFKNSIKAKYFPLNIQKEYETTQSN